MARKRGITSKINDSVFLALFSGKRSQLTAFMLIGIVMLAIFGFMYYASKSTQSSNIERQINVAEENIRETNILRQYVTLCLKESLETGLVMAGDQGGMIEQPYEYIEYESSKVAFGIKESQFNAQMPGPPAYPCIMDPGTNSYPCSPTPYNPILAPKKLYGFGKKNLTALCDPKGPNAAYLSIVPYPCPTGTYGNNSVQEQLKDYIEQRLGDCVNLTPIEQVTGLSITNGTPNVSIIFGEDEVIAMTTYPLNMSIDRYSSVKLFDFQVNIPVRIKKMFGLVDYIAKNELYDIEFVPEEDYTSYKYFGKDVMPALEVSRYNAGPGIDIIEVNDSASIIRGNAYSFRFAVQNRIPALDYIPDVTVTEGQSVMIHPQAYDADDSDAITYSASGWKDGYWSYTGSDLIVSTSDGDAGSHEVDIYACDTSDKCDLQRVSIEVNNAG
ncbi:MAG: hypothetical protein KKE20_02700 [Nanoarchaeota archaeon]|nr:hypothetical protein [Nanoarchaeota archaeon]